MRINARDHGLSVWATAEENKQRLQTLLRSVPEGSTIVIPPGRYSIVGELVVSGTKAAWIECQPGSVFDLKSDGTQRTQFTCIGDMNGLVVSGLSLDASAVPSKAPVTAVFYGAGASNITLRNLNITGAPTGAGIQFTSREADGHVRAPANVTMMGCRVTGRGPKHEPHTQLISVTGHTAQRRLGKTPKQFWIENTEAIPIDSYARNIRIINCSVKSGYYGIGLSAVADSVISGNQVTDVMRGISMQDSSKLNVVHSNEIRQNISAGIHLAYGSSDNAVTGNHVVSSVAIGEGMLQAYIGCHRNKFSDNITSCTGAEGGAKYHLYTGVKCSGNDFRNNSLSGRCQRAYMSAESDWDDQWLEKRHRGFDTTGISHMSGGAPTSASFVGNFVAAASDVPAVWLATVGHGSVMCHGSGLNTLMGEFRRGTETATHGSGTIHLT